MSPEKIVTYWYRATRKGLVLYSEQGPKGPMLPWMRRVDCRADAVYQGARAVFMAPAEQDR